MGNGAASATAGGESPSPSIETPLVTTRAIHLDTSVQIERCKEPRLSQPVENLLKTYSFRSTSSYAKLEFKRSWIRDLAYLHEQCIQLKDWRLVQSKVTSAFSNNPQSGRRLNRCIQAINSFLATLPGNLSLEAANARFLAWLQESIMGWWTWWSRSVHHEFNGTQCARAAEKPTQSQSGHINVVIQTCSPSKISCAVNTFFKDNYSKFDQIASHAESNDSISEELKKSARVIRLAQVDPNSLCNNTECAKVGDAIISIDSGSVGVLGAHNPREWTHLSLVLGRELVDPVSASTLPSGKIEI
jgi:hypothetical protein